MDKRGNLSDVCGHEEKCGDELLRGKAANAATGGVRDGLIAGLSHERVKALVRVAVPCVGYGVFFGAVGHVLGFVAVVGALERD